jgi:hypothetical protein
MIFRKAVNGWNGLSGYKNNESWMGVTEREQTENNNRNYELRRDT